jgi:hypothetical protein
MVACPGDSTTELTGLGETLTVAVALRPSLEAVMVAVPDEIAVTRPSEVTVATCGRLVAHTMTRSVNGAPDHVTRLSRELRRLADEHLIDRRG